MKTPTKSSITKTVEIWLCNNPNHRHRTQEVAKICIMNQNKKANKKILSQTDKEEIYQLYKNANTLRLIGNKFQKSPERIRQIIAKHEQLLSTPKDHKNFLNNLSVRTRNALNSEGINSIEKIIETNKSFLLKIPNFGKLSLKELEQELSKIGINY